MIKVRSMGMARRGAPEKSNMKWILFLAFFGLCLALAYGTGYQMGRNSAPQAIAHSSFSPASAASSGTPSPASSQNARASEGYASLPRTWPGRSQAKTVWVSSALRKYTLYFASFKKFSDAEKEKARLESHGLMGVEISERRMPSDAMPWYRLGYGRFNSRAAAVEYGRQLIDRGLIRDFWPTELP